MEKASWIDNLKMRLSWGQTGSTNVSDFSFRQFYTSSQYGESSSVKLQDLLPNRGIHWEKTNEVNFGLDFSFFGDRLYGSWMHIIVIPMVHWLLLLIYWNPECRIITII